MDERILGAIFLLLLTSNSVWTVSSPWDCDFEYGNCGYLSVTNGKLGWKRVRGEKSFIQRGPPADHTPGKDGKGWFMKTNEGEIGSSTLQSKSSLDIGKDYCLSFYYYQSGEWLHTLYVITGASILMELNGDKEASRVTHEIWHHVEVDIPKEALKKKRSLRFLVKKTQKGESDTSIDDVVLTNGKCKPALGPDCTFERGQCGWKRPNEATAPFTIATKIIDPIFNSSDHTLGTDYGHFMLASKEKGKNTNKIGITSPTLTFTTPVCLRFFYKWSGLANPKIRLESKLASAKGQGEEIWDNHVDLKYFWNRAEVTIMEPNGVQISIYFYPEVGKDDKQEMGLDDIFFTPGLCSREVSITFESGKLAPLRNLPNGNDFNWQVTQATTSLDKYLPAKDMTLETSKGHVAFASGGSAGSNATMISPFSSPSTSSCLKFYVYASGKDPGRLIITLRTLESEKEVWSWTPGPNEKDKFVEAEFPHFSKSYYRTLFTVVMGENGGWAIDSIRTYPSRNCRVLPETASGIPGSTISTTKVTTPKPLPANGYFDCSFDKDLCNWKTAKSSQVGWRISTDSLETTYPKRDHSSPGQGKFLHLGYGYRALPLILESPKFVPETNDQFGSTGCLSFWYYIWKQSGWRVELKVFASDKQGAEKIFYADKSTQHWTRARINIVKNKEFELHIQGLKYGYDDDISIDDIVYTKTPCDGNTAKDCQFEQSDKCGFTSDENAQFQWKLQTNLLMGDHSTKTQNGHVMMLLGKGRRVEDEASLISKQLNPMSGCLTFWVYGGNNTGQLIVKRKTYAKRNIFTKEIYSKNKWIEVAVPVSSKDSFSLIFTGKITSSLAENNYLALDDIKIRDEECETRGACSFEDISLCLWRNVGGDDFNWIVIQANALTNQIHPRKDKTLDYASGKILFFNPSTKSQGLKAIYESQSFLHENVQCMEFFTSISGATLTVYVVDQNGKRSLVFRNYKTSNDWKHYAISVGDVKTTYTVQFEGETEYDTNGGIAIDDITFSPGRCDGDEITLIQTTPKPMTPPSTKQPVTHPPVDLEKTKYDCDFEDNNLCNWSSNAALEKTWLLYIAAQQNIKDYTLKSGSGHVLASPQFKSIGDKAEIISPEIPAGERCLIFYVKAPQIAGSSLKVFKQLKNLQFPVYHARTFDSSDWHRIELPFASKSSKYQIIIQTSMETKTSGNIYLDDIKTAKGSCPKDNLTFNDVVCDFEDGKRMCGFTKDLTGDYNWIVSSRGNPSTVMDHTFDSKTGHFLLSGVSSGKKEGSKARIISPTYKADDKSSHCLSFFYHMNGYNIGALNVYVAFDGREKSVSPDMLKWSRQYDVGPQWQKAFVQIHTTRPYNVVFETVKSKKDYIYGIDDLQIQKGVCPDKDQCDFEYDECVWNNKGSDTDNYGLWTWFTPSQNPGLPTPPIDHTYHSPFGHFLLFPIVHHEMNSSYARIYDMVRDPSSVTNSSCFTFWYHMFGDDVGTLNVYVRDGASNSTPFSEATLWEMNGATGDNKWHSAQVPISSVYTKIPFQIIIEAVAGSATKGDIAVDDTKFLDHSCEILPSAANPTKDYLQRLNCNFDGENTCQWSQSNSDDTDFSFAENHNELFSTFVDRTTEQGGHGKMLILKNNNGKDNSIAVLRSPVMFPTGGVSCLSLWYSISNQAESVLSVLIRTGTQSQQLLSVKDLNGWYLSWKLATVNIHSDMDYQLILNAELKSKDEIIAIDDIKLNHGACPRKVFCDFEANQCNFQMVKDSDFDWKRLSVYQAPDPLPRYGADGYYQGFYMATNFKDQKSGDRARIETSMLLPSKGECVSLYVSFGYSTNGEGDSTYKGFFTVNLVKKQADGGKGAETKIYRVLILRNQDWIQIHFDVKSETPYWLIFEAEVNSPNGYVAIDDISFSSLPCPSALSCDFEAGGCGYKNIHSNFRWSRTNSGLTSSRWYIDEHDHTTGTSAGYYLLYQYDSKAKAGNQEATLQSVYQWKKSQCLVLWYAGFGTATIGVYKQTFDKKETQIIQKTITFKKISTDQDYEWDYLRMDLSSESSFYLLIKAKSKVPDTVVAIDDVKVQTGSCEEIDKKENEKKNLTPYYDASKLKFVCNFDDEICTFDKDSNWMAKNTLVLEGTGPFFDHTKSTVYGKYAYTASEGAEDNIKSQTSAWSFTATGKVCIDFYLSMFGDKNTSFNMYIGNSDNKVLYFHRQGDLGNKWWHETVELQGIFKDTAITLEAKFEKYDTGYVALDDFYIYNQPCPPPTVCDFEEGGLCGFQQDNVDHYDWSIIEAGNSSEAGPKTDHSLQTGKGHYAVLDAKKAGSNIDAALVSPMYRVNDAKCLTFWYYMKTKYLYQVDHDLNIYTRDESGKEELLDHIISRSSRDWNIARYPIQVKHEKIQFILNAVSRIAAGVIAMDDIEISPIACHGIINCNFIDDGLCDWQNVEDNKIDWRADLGMGGGLQPVTLTVPLYPFREAVSSVSILESEQIPVEVVMDYCIELKYDFKGKVIRYLAVYYEDANLREYLQKNITTGEVNKVYISAKTTLYATKMRVRIKAFYGNEREAGSVSLYHIKFHEGRCSEVKEAELEGYQCSENTNKLPSKKVCDFENDCQSNNASDEYRCGNCTFENNPCGWVDESDGSASFFLTKNFSIPGNINTHQNFMMLSSGFRDQNSHGNLVFNNLMGPSPSGCVMAFDYYTESFSRGQYSTIRYPVDYGTLAVMLEIDEQKTVIWRSPRNTSQDWHTAFVDIGHIRNRFKIHFQATHYSYIRNIIAIDSIAIRSCHFPDIKEVCGKFQFACKVGGCIPQDRRCDLEMNCRDGSDEDPLICKKYTQDSFENGFGHWQQDDIADDFDWVRHQGASANLKNGPRRDHTLGTNRGHYILMEGGSHKRGDMARLIGPTLKPATSSSLCMLRLFMHQLGEVGDGALNIYMRTTLEGPMKKIQTLYPLKFDAWIKKEFLLTSNDNFQIVLEGTVGSFHTSDIGIDDISFTSSCKVTSETLLKGIKPTPKPSKCETDQFECASGKITCVSNAQMCDFIRQCDDGSDEQNCGSCSFDQDSCGWEDVSPGHVMFQLSKASNAKEMEPTRDHTTNSSSGSYMAIVNGNGDFTFPAKIVGHVLPETGPACKLEVYFYKRGPTRGKITVGLQRPDDDYNNRDKVAELAFHDFHQAQWLRLSAGFGRIPAGYQPYVEITSNHINEDIAVAIDDISFVDCEPNKVFNLSDINCDFENDICDWFNDHWNGVNFKRTDLTTPTPNTGPDRDHTTGSGYYIYATSPNVNIGSGVSNAYLTTGLLEWPEGGQEGCLSFWYHMFGAYAEKFEIYTIQNKNLSTIIYSKSKSQGNVWRPGFAKIKDINGNFQIKIQAYLPNYLGDIAFDDIKITMADCPIIPECDFEFEFCNFDASSKAWDIVKATGVGFLPSFDQTLHSKEGHVMAFDPNHVKSSGATLTSPVYNRLQEKMCLNFYYYARTQDVACDIYVVAQGDRAKDGVNIWNTKGISPGWNYVAKTFKPKDKYQIIFVGAVNNKNFKTISFDDFRVEEGECPQLGSCNFEKDACGYTSRGVSNTVVWQRNSGAFLNEETGPPVDHTTKTQEGFYMVADSGINGNYIPWYFTISETFYLDSPSLPATTQSCLSFWLYMNGQTYGVGTFTVYLNDGGSNSQTVFHNDYSLGERWHYEAFNVSSTKFYQIVFKVDQGKKFKSDVAIDDVVMTDGDCTQRKPSVLLPDIPKTYPPTKFDCDFDKGHACNWTLSNIELSRLEVVNKGASDFNAKLYDHTQENMQGSFVMFYPSIKVPVAKKAQSHAKMVSPFLEDSNVAKGACFKFWYMIEENAEGNLTAGLAGDSSSNTIWLRGGVTESGWVYAQVYVNPKILSSMKTKTQFVIEFKSVYSKFEEFRVDDISMNEGPCPENLEHCDFEDPGNCGFVQDQTEYLDWRESPPYGTKNVPNLDHSYGTSFGHYMVLYRNNNDAVGAVTGRMLSPVLHPTQGKCLRFFYYMDAYKFQIETSSEEGNQNLIWKKLYNTGKRWRGGQADLKTETTSRVVFEGTLYDAYNGFIALDDISLVNHPCPDPGTCNFEDDMCLFHNVKGTDNFDWLRHSGSTSSKKTGASVDATTNTEYGHYLFIESSSPRQNGDKAQLESELLPSTYGSCLTFSYHMYGEGIGQLNIIKDVLDNPQLLLTIKGNQGDSWKRKSIFIKDTYRSFSLIFEGVIGKSAKSDIALDDIIYTDGPCNQTENTNFTCDNGQTVPLDNVCDFVHQCSDGSDEMDCGSCTFEKSLCGYVSVGIGGHSFRRSKGSVKNLGNDHTLDTKFGHMVFVDGVDRQSSKAVILKSPLIQKSYQTCQVKFYYKMMNYYSSFQVMIQFQSQSPVPIFSVTEVYNIGSWVEATAQIGNIHEPFHIVFSAQKATYSIPFAIDDITLEGCDPPASYKFNHSIYFTCHSGYQVPPNVVCDLSDDCGDGSDEMNCQNVSACTFETSLCAWSNVPEMTGYWYRSYGISPQAKSGPLRDHTTGTPSGYFLNPYLGYWDETSAGLISPVIAGVKENEQCQLTVYYQMRGLGIGTMLNIYTQTASNGYKTKLFTKHNQHQDYWDRYIQPLKSTLDFQVIIEAVGTGRSETKIGLDDLVFSSDCHLSGFYATLPTPTAPITTQKNIINTCLYQNQYQCADDTCIDSKQVCDFSKDCKDGSDEQNCGSCDFENGWCGWYQSSAGRLQFSISSPSVMGKFGPDKDFTLKTNKGHYIYVTPSTGISDTPIVIESGPLPPVSNICSLSFQAFFNTKSNFGKLYIIAVKKESSILIGIIESYWYDRWEYFHYSLKQKQLNDGWHLKISLSYPDKLVLPRDGMFAIDDIKFEDCSLNDHEAVLSCSFGHTICDWKQSQKDIFNWEIQNKSTMKFKPRIHFWDEVFLIARSQGRRQNDIAILKSPTLPPITGNSSCLSFWYYIPGNTGTLSINKVSRGGVSRIFVSQKPSEVNEWKKVYLSLMSDYRFTIEIAAKVSGHSGDDIMVDEILFKSNPCEKEYKGQCTFDDIDMCTWTQGKASQIDWSVKNSISTSGVSKPATDHTTRSKYGYYAYVETNEDDRGDHAILTSSLALSEYTPHCFNFWFHIAGNTSSLIRVSVNKNSETPPTNKLLVTYPGPTNNMWRRGAVKIESYLRPTEIVLTGILNGGYGHIAIDDTHVLEGNCFGPGSCDFKYDLCGYVNAPSNKFDFVIDKLRNNYYYGYATALAQPLTDTKKGDTAALISEPIFKGGCLRFYRYLKSSKSVGLVSGSLSVYTRQLISPQKRTLVKTMNYFVRNEYMPPIYIDLSDKTNFEIIFEVIYNSESIGIYNVLLDNYPCSFTTTVSPITTVPPSIPPIHPPSPLDCQFGSNLCGWNILQHESTKWALNKDAHYWTKPATLYNFHIPNDHTIETADGGFINVVSVDESLAYLLSPKVTMNGSMCFQFWYYMFGSNVGTLKVVLNTKTILWTKTGTLAPKWHFAAIHITGVDEGVISLEASGSRFDSEIGIDDISAFFGKCPENNRCDFENGDCGYELKAPWKLVSEIPMMGMVYPLSGDHTEGTPRGHCLAMDAKSGRFTTTIFSVTEGSCLTFWYHMDGYDKASLVVSKLNTDSTMDNSEIVFSVSGSQGPTWQLGTIDISESTKFVLIFEGSLEGKLLSDTGISIIIDDIKLVDGKCPHFGSCDFEDELCPWTNVKEVDSNDWMQFKGNLLSNLALDHTTGTKYGGYLIMNNDLSSNAILASPTLQKNTQYCLYFWAILNDNSLTVNTTDLHGHDLSLIDKNHVGIIEKNAKPNDWKLYQFDLDPSLTQFQITIEGKSATTYFYLDDISIHSDYCSNVTSIAHRHQHFYCNTSKTWHDISKKCDFKIDCLGNNEEQACGYDCDFESQACKWKTNKEMNSMGEWVIGTGNTFTFQAIADHTLDTVNGHFMYVYSLVRYANVILQSPLLQMSGTRCELIFNFFVLNGDKNNYFGQFTVYKIQKSRTLLMKINKNDFAQSQWEKVYILLGRMTSPFYIEITSTPGVLIDDIILNNCNLPTKDDCVIDTSKQFTCDNSACVDAATVCNFQDDCGDNSDEGDKLCKNYKMNDFEDGSLGFWGQEIGTDEFDWHVYQSEEYVDHTTISSSGHVASAANYRRSKKTDRAHLISPAFGPGDKCTFTLYYKMEHGSKGSFNIYKRHEVNGDLSILHSPEPEGKFTWKQIQLVISDKKAFQIVLEINAKFQSTIDIDDTVFDQGCTLYKGEFPVLPPKPRPTPKPMPCSYFEYTCGDGSCIPQSQICDFLNQCQDGSDEKQCSACDFESDQCEWRDDSIGSFGWQRAKSPSASTDSKFSINVYKIGTLNDAPAILTSGYVGASPSGCFITFMFFVKSPSQTDMAIEYQQYNMYGQFGEKYVLNYFKARDLSIGTWNKIESLIGYQKYGGKIILKASGMGLETIVAIDDVQFNNCAMGQPMDKCSEGQFQCSNKVCISTNERCDSHIDCSDGSDEENCYTYSRCDFEYGLCDFSLDPTSSANWTRKDVNSAFKELSPARDHSKNSRDGYFLEFGPSFKQRDLYGKIKSPVVFAKQGKDACQMRFFYYQKVDASGTLNIYSQYEEDGPLKLEWSNQHGTYGIWEKASIRLTYKRPFKIIIEGVAKIKIAVALDDISFTPLCYIDHMYSMLPMTSPFRTQGSCALDYFQCDGTICLPNRYFCDMTPQCDDGTDEIFCGIPCDFENGSCGWTYGNEGSNTNISSVAVKKYENIDNDHNPGSSEGHVISFTDWYEVFESPYYENSFGNCKFTFWYKRVRSSSASIKYNKPDGSYLELLQLNEPLTSSTNSTWTKASAQLPVCASHFHVTIQSQKNYFGNDDSLTALVYDDFNFEDCPTKKYVTGCKVDEFMCSDRLSCIPNLAKCDLSNDCCDGSDEDVYLCYGYRRFTFDDGYEGWEQRSDDDDNWSLSRYLSYGLPYDHTHSSSSGAYMIYNNYEAKYNGKISFPMNVPFAECHVRLWYAGVSIYTKTSGTLNVYLYSINHIYKKLTSVQVSNGDWNKLDVEIKSSTTYELVLEAKGGVISPSGICLDDISFTPGCNMGSPTPPPTFIPPTVPVPTDQTGTTLPPACPGKFHCKNSNECIEMSRTCDFTFDCLDQTDENNCYTIELCDFTHDNCGWTSSSTEKGLKWVRDTTSGAKQGLAPSYDASLHQGENAYFMYLSVNPGQQMEGKDVSLVSREFNGAGASCQIHFSYFMQGSGVSLSMYVTNKKATDLLWHAETKNNGWQRTSVGIGRRVKQFTLEIRKVFSSEYNGITAVDNIQFSNCPEPPKVDLCVPEEKTFTCKNKACIDKIHKCDGQDDCGDSSDEGNQFCDRYDFMSFEMGFNLMTQAPAGVEDSLDWKIWKSDQSPAIGLQGFDHSTFSSNGHYAYVQSIKSGDSAWLLSSNWVVTGNGGYCQGSVYVMAPEDSSKISIGYRTHNKGNLDQQISAVQSTGSVWTQVHFNISVTQPFQLVFQAQFSAAGAAIAMDDFVMYDGKGSTCKVYSQSLPNLKCPTTKFECGDGVCIDSNKKCNGKNDCKDGSDEINCATSLQTTKTTTVSTVVSTVVSTDISATDKSADKTVDPRIQTTTDVDTDHHQKEKSVSSKSDDSWKTPVGVVLGLVAVIAITVVVIVFLKRNQRLTWLTMPSLRKGLSFQKNGVDNPLFDYGTGGSSDSGPVFQMQDVSPSHPDDVFGESTKTAKDNSSFANPLYVDSEG